MSKGCSISNEERAIIVKKNDLRLAFNKEIKMKNGYVCRIELTVKSDDNYCFATVGDGGKQDITFCTRNLDTHPNRSFARWPNIMNGLFSQTSSSHVRVARWQNLARRIRTKSLWPKAKLPANGSSSTSAASRIRALADWNFGSLQWTMPPILPLVFFSSQKIKQQRQ